MPAPRERFHRKGSEENVDLKSTLEKVYKRAVEEMEVARGANARADLQSVRLQEFESMAESRFYSATEFAHRAQQEHLVSQTSSQQMRAALHDASVHYQHDRAALIQQYVLAGGRQAATQELMESHADA